ncbi:MAG: allantoinase AllB [Candidatus Kariarchaeaceae archaeon]|jgi:allantoinase
MSERIDSQWYYSTAILSDSGWIAGYMQVTDGIITKLTPDHPHGIIEDLGDLMIIPGLIDTHVHVNEPGRTHWEGFETATKAAIRGGITTLIDMPLNSSPVTVSRENLETKIREMTQTLYSQVGFHGGIVPESIHEIEELQKSGIFGLKVFTIHSGIDEFGHIGTDMLREVMERVKAVDGQLMVHAELETAVDPQGDPCSYNTYLNSRPRSWENEAIDLLIDLMRETGCRVHIIHLSSADAITPIKRAKEEGLPLTVETCPHYLYFDSEAIPDRATQFKCAPPIREKSNQVLLWQALKDNLIDFIASDHSPSPPDLKDLENGNFMKAWGGIASLQFSFQAALSRASTHDMDLSDIVEKMAKQPAAFLGLVSKGKLAVGMDADFVIFDPSGKTVVREENISHRHKLTPYMDTELPGKVVATYIRGKKVFSSNPIQFTPVDQPLLFRKEL